MNPVNAYDAFAATITANGGLDYTDEQVAAVSDVLDAAQAWQDGTLPLSAFARVGTLKPRAWTDEKRGIICRGNDHTGYTRFKAIIWAYKTRDPRLAALQSALAALGAIERSMAA
jgi:hypothetical protein